MKSSLSLLNLVALLLLPALFSCSRQALTVSGADDHYNADTYYVAGGFDSEEDRQGREASINGPGDNFTNRDRGNRAEGADRNGSDFGRRNNDLGRADRWVGSRGWEDDERGTVFLDDDLGMSIADYRRAYRRGYRDGQWDANALPGLYSPNYGGWGWGIGPGIGWNAPCWSWGGGWNYYAYWNNPWNSWNNPWGNGWGWGGGYGWGGWNGWGGGYGWGGGWNSWGYGGWNHWGSWNRWGWGGWNGWGGNTYVWIYNQPRYRSGPRRDRLNQINVRNSTGNRMTPWGQARVNGTSRRHGDFVSRVSAINGNRQNPSSANVVASAGSNEQRGRRFFSLPYAQSRSAQREGVDNRTRTGVDYAGNPSGSSRDRNYSFRDRFSESRTNRGSYFDKGTERTYGNDKVRGSSWVNRSPRSEYRSPRSEDNTPRSSYSTPRSSYSTPRSSYSTPRSSYSTPRSSYSTPRSSYSTPRSTYSAPRSSFGSSTRSSSGSSRSFSGSSSGSGRSGSFSPRR